MLDESKIRRDRNYGYPKYDKFEDHNGGLTHQCDGYSRKDGRYYECGYGENISDESKRESGKPFSK